MEFRKLRYFIAVAEALNFSKASLLLHVAQPALSRQVQQLEEFLGVPLLERSPRGVTLTAEGRLFLEEARSIVAHAEASICKVKAFARGETGELNIGYAPSVGGPQLAPAMAKFQKNTPKVSVILHDLSGNELAEGLRAGSLDFCVMQRPRGKNGTGLAFEALQSYPICVGVATSHPLARQKAVSLSLISGEKLVVFRRKDFADYHALLDEVFASLPGVRRPANVVECDGANSVFTEIEAGHGIAILPQVLVKVIGSRFKMIPLTPAPAPLEVGICRSLKHEVTAAEEKFFGELRAVAKIF